MIKQHACGWSGIFSKQICKICNKKNQIQVIQIQDKYSIVSLGLVGKNSRYFGKECTNCNSIIALAKSQISDANTIKYYDKRPKFDEDGLIEGKRKKYPVLTEKRRTALIKENKREGQRAAVIGSGFGLVLLIFSPFWGLVIAGLSILGGLYAAYEDPERKHRGYIDKKKH